MAKHRRVSDGGGGRHHLGPPPRVYCRNLAAVRTRLESTRAPWFSALRLRGRHTPIALTRSGIRPRPAFVLIASL
jgi:hypothetical protein